MKYDLITQSMNLKYWLLLLSVSILPTACSDQNDSSIKHYVSEEMKQLDLPFSSAVIVDDMIYLSGQIGTIPGTTDLVEGGLREEAKQTMQNIQAVLEANGATMKDIVKCTVMIDDIAEWGTFNEEYIKFFPGKKPARSAFGADGLAMGARVEVECIACVDD